MCLLVPWGDDRIPDSNDFVVSAGDNQMNSGQIAIVETTNTPILRKVFFNFVLIYLTVFYTLALVQAVENVNFENVKC